jgi:hypothetical protein
VPFRHDPADSLADIIDNAARVKNYLAGMDRQAFERDGRTRDGRSRVYADRRVADATTLRRSPSAK